MPAVAYKEPILNDMGFVASLQCLAVMIQDGWTSIAPHVRNRISLEFLPLNIAARPRLVLAVRPSHLATHTFGWDGVEMTGLPVDLQLDPRTPFADIAADFDRLHINATSDNTTHQASAP